MNSTPQDKSNGATVDAPQASGSAVDQLTEQARASLDRGDAVTASRLIEQALAEDGNQPSVLELAGVVRCRTGQLEDGIAAFQRLTEIQPESASAWFNLGKALNDGRRHREAIPALSRALEAEPDFSAAKILMGLAQRDLGETEAAVQTLEQAHQESPRDPTAATALAALYGDRGDFHRSIELFQEAVNANPSLALAHYNLGKGRLARAVSARQASREPDAADLSGAADCFRQALLIDYYFQDARLGLGEVAEARQQWQEALNHYRKVNRRRPGDLRASIMLMRLLIATGRLSEAQEQLKVLPRSAPPVLTEFWSAQIDGRRGIDVAQRLENLRDRQDAQSIRNDIEAELSALNQPQPN